MAENPFAAPAEIRPAPGGLISVEQQRAVAEVQARMLIARANPRDPRRAVEQILQDCTRLSLAERALYQYNRGGTDISGPSIRLAEAMAQRWGNIASGVKEVERRDGYSECISYAWDLETGYYDERQFHVKHWRDTKKGGYPVTDERDIYEMIANMGQRRKRAVLLAVIPGDVVEEAVKQCEETLHTQADTSPEAIKKMVEAFAAFGVTQAQIEARCQRRLEAIRPAQIFGLRRIYVSLKDEMSEPSDWFETAAPSPAANLRGKDALRSRLGLQPPPEDETEEDEPPGEAGHARSDGPLDDPPPAATRPRRRRKADEPTDTEIERSQENIAAVLEQGDPKMEIVKPQRLPRDAGWDWPLYADQLIAAALRTPIADLGRLRGVNASMFDVLRASNREEWERVNAALADYERDGVVG